MSRFRRLYVPGGCYFFTVVTHRRTPWLGNGDNVALLRAAFRQVKQRRPFELQAIVVLPDHLHCLWRLPDGDKDFPGRWREIKKYVSRRLDGDPLWQRRYWEHLIRDSYDWERHLDYIHYNPVKHGLVERPLDWRWSSFRMAVKKGWYDADWGASDIPAIARENWE